jgi:hypothetical protein
MKLLDGSFKEGDTVEVGARDGSLVFTAAVAQGA